MHHSNNSNYEFTNLTSYTIKTHISPKQLLVNIKQYVAENPSNHNPDHMPHFSKRVVI